MTEVSKVSLNVKCPICGLEKTILVPEYVFDNKQFGALKIQIPQGSVCTEHQFIIYVDKNGNIRSYETSDYQLPIVKREQKQDLMTISDFVGMVGVFATLNVLHALLLDIPIFMVQPVVDSRMQHVINETINSLMPGFFRNVNEMRLVNRSEFLKFKETDNILVIDQEGYILMSPWEINNFEIESELLEKIMKLNDYNQQKIIFQQLLTSFFRKLNFVGEMLLKQEVIHLDELKKLFKKNFMQKRVSNYEIELIKSVLEYRFKKDTSRIQLKSLNKLKESLW